MKLDCSFLFLCLLLFSDLRNGRIKAQRSKKKSSIKPPIKLGPGEVAIQEPRWQQVYDMKVTKYWKAIKSPNYPTFTGSQMQASWILEAPINWRVKVAFKDMSLAPRVGESCRSVYVDLIDPKAGKSQGRSCSSEVPGDYVSIGSTMRLDLMSDKVAGKYRGFVAMAIITREAPGRRTAKTFPSRKTSPVLPSGKVNFNNFKSFQSKFKPPVPIIPKGVRLVYASDKELLDDTEIVEVPINKIDEDEWDDGPINQPTSSLNPETRNKVARGPAGTGPVAKGPVRYFAKVHPTKKPKPVDDGLIEYTTKETGDGARDWLFYYGDSHQPKISDPIPIIRPDEDDKSWKFTTLHLVIIASAVVLSILIISIVFIIKRSCLDPVKNQKSVHQDSCKSIKGNDKSIELPRIDSDLKDKFAFNSMGQYQNRPVEHQVAFYGATPIHPMWNDFKKSASRNSLYHRPLPPPPGDPPIRSIDVDEDYCSGDEDMVTMKHEYSCWELEKKKPKPITFED